MKIRTIEINNVAGITRLELSFNDQMNILCGPNGIGKTTILECCAHSFSLGSTSVLKRRVGSLDGTGPTSSVTAGLKNGERFYDVKIDVNQHDPIKASDPAGDFQNAGFILSLKTGRVFSYQALDAVRKDAPKSLPDLIEGVKTGI